MSGSRQNARIVGKRPMVALARDRTSPAAAETRRRYGRTAPPICSAPVEELFWNSALRIFRQ
jgi:hypothetical protein